MLGITDEPIEAFLDDQPGLDESELVEEAADAAALDEDRDEDPDEDLAPEPPRRPVKKTRGRASVPSWDEIMFGGPSRSSPPSDSFPSQPRILSLVGGCNPRQVPNSPVSRGFWPPGAEPCPQR